MNSRGAGGKTRQNLVRRPLRMCGDGRNAGIGVAADQRDAITDLAWHIGHVAHRHVHGDKAGYAHAAIVDQRSAPAPRAARIPVGIPERDGCDPPSAGGTP